MPVVEFPCDRLGVVFTLPKGCNADAKANIERAAKRLQATIDLLMDRGDIAAVMKVQENVANQIAAMLIPIYDKLITQQPIDDLWKDETNG